MRQDGGRPSPGMRPRLLDASGRDHRHRWALHALAALAVLLLIPQAVGSARVPARLAERGRGQARTWLLDHLPPGSQVMVEGFGRGNPPPPGGPSGAAAPGISWPGNVFAEGTSM